MQPSAISTELDRFRLLHLPATSAMSLDEAN
jgi:hypothetical protein